MTRMAALAGMVCLGLLSRACSVLAQEPDGAEPSNPLTEAIRVAREAAGTSERLFLWKMAFFLREKYSTSEWEKILADFQEAGFDLQDMKPLPMVLGRFTAMPKALTDEKGRICDLEIEVISRRGKAESGQAVDPPYGDPLHVVPILRVHLDQSYSDAVTLYDEHSTIGRALRCKDVRDKASSFPILDNVEISYQVKWDFRNGVGEPSFIVDVSLRADGELPVPGCRLRKWISSGLDPIRYAPNNPKLDGFESKDTLGEVKGLGSGGWQKDKPK